MLICSNEGYRVRQGHYEANRRKKLKKLKERKVGTCQSTSASRRVDLQLALSSSMPAYGQNKLGEQTSDSATDRRDRRCQSGSLKVTERFDEKALPKRREEEYSAHRRPLRRTQLTPPS
uniref:Uncharacterized protein n=1 Tax=Solanum tuberosum TaxID=4113 RepID=M1DVD9_SOLTU